MSAASKSLATTIGACPDLPGRIATGATLVEVEQAIREARFHIAGLREDGQPVPPPPS